ncbi:MAG: Hsp20/alpha crystallin family protein [Cyanobacteria bacterium P01_F01_bin.53]
MIVRRYWQPIQEFNTVKQQLDQLFDDLSAGVQAAPTTWTPAVTLVEGENALTLHVQLPGIDPDNIDIQASREVVAISGERTAPTIEDGPKVRRNEFRYGSFRRVVSLPIAIDHQAVTADYEAGILVLTLPKAEAERNKVVKVNIAGASDKAVIEPATEPAASAVPVEESVTDDARSEHA